MKKIAVINDLSGFGRCSLTAAIPVMAVMGVQANPLPTSILTAQTGFDHYYCEDFTEKMHYFTEEWEKMGKTFDGIYTGFVSNEAQIDEIFHFIRTFKKENTFLLVDPVLGDDGVPYDMFSNSLLEKMKALVEKADIITPNLTELCLLTGTSYQDMKKIDSGAKVKESIGKLAKKLSGSGEKKIVVTGLHYMEEGTEFIGNLYIARNTVYLSGYPYVGGSFSGTGDLFASILAAGIARGKSIPELIRTTGLFLEKAIADAAKEGIAPEEGCNFEKFLPLLMPV